MYVIGLEVIILSNSKVFNKVLLAIIVATTICIVAVGFIILPKIGDAAIQNNNSINDELFSQNQNPYFNATVIEVYENSVLVEPFENEKIRKSSDKINVTTKVISTNPVPKLKKGMQIRVVYNGEVLETYPASLGGVFAIYELDKNGEVFFGSADIVEN